MKTDIRLPLHFKEYKGPGNAIISNFDHSINLEIEKAIQFKPLFSRYTDRHMNAVIWWNDEMR